MNVGLFRIKLFLSFDQVLFEHEDGLHLEGAFALHGCSPFVLLELKTNISFSKNKSNMK